MISVVIPAFNEENLIRECLESLKNQDFTGGYEVIVVDNGSNDNTFQIARDAGVKVVFCPQQRGLKRQTVGAEKSPGVKLSFRRTPIRFILDGGLPEYTNNLTLIPRPLLSQVHLFIRILPGGLL